MLYNYCIVLYPLYFVPKGTERGIYMKKRIAALLLSVFAVLSVGAVCCAVHFEADSDGKYTFEYTADSADTDYIMLVVAGDYTSKDAPAVSSDNIIYMNQVKSDADKKIKLEDFIPLTGSVGTVFLCGEGEPEIAGLIMTESGIGFESGKIVSYTGTGDTLVVPPELAYVDSGVVIDAKYVVLPSVDFQAKAGAFSENTKLYFSPEAQSAKQYASDNGYTHRYLGDYDGDDAVDMIDMSGILGHYAKASSEAEDFSVYFDLDTDGSVTLHDVSVLMRYLGGVISDYSE